MPPSPSCLLPPLLLLVACGSADKGPATGSSCNTDGRGAGNFTERRVDASQVHGQQQVIVDMNGDGRNDVLVSFSLTDSLHLYLNDCDSFRLVEIAPPDTLVATGVAAADFDDDGDMDVVGVEVFSRNGDSQSSVRWYENPGNFEDPWREHGLTAAGSEGARTVHTADLSGDGLADIIVGTVDGPGVIWFLNTGGDFAGPLEVDTSLDGIQMLLVHDVDGDGALDVVTAANGSEEISWYESDRGSDAATAIVFTKHAIDSVGGPNGLSLGNFDDDPALELVANNNRGIELYDPPADPTGAWTSSSITSDFGGDEDVYVVAADLDGDSKTDIAVTSSDSSTIRAYLASEGGFSAREIDSDYAGISALSVGDIDGDGDMDLLTSTYEHGGGTDLISWWENRP